jgi:hypothetical protein
MNPAIDLEEIVTRRVSKGESPQDSRRFKV